MSQFLRARFSIVGDFCTDEVKSLPELVRFNATHNPTQTFSYQLEHKNGQLLRTSFQELCNAVDHCIGGLLESLPEIRLAKLEEQKLVTSAPVAILLESGLNLFAHIAALLSIGTPVVVLSARLSTTAIHHLLRETDAQTLITSGRLFSQEAVSSVGAHHPIKTYITQPCNFSTFASPQMQLAPILEDNCEAFVLHSSGTTGLPKPIYHPQRYVLGYAACHEFRINEDVPGVNVSTLPMYHGFGLLAPMLALSIGMPCCLPSPTSVPTAESTVTLIQATSAKSLMTVPSILEDMLQDEDANIPTLAALDFVAAGGGPMKPEVASRLAERGVKLLNHFGATELGALAPIFKPGPDYDWRYLRLRQDMDLQILPDDPEHPNGLFKLIGYPVGRSSVFTLQDRIELRPGSIRDIRLLGRSDDVIVLGNGEKAMPQLLESALSALSGVKTALAFGNGQFEVGVLVEPVNTNQEDTAELKNAIWTKILKVNPNLDSHARIFDPRMVLIVQDGQRVPRSDKGSIMRSEAYRVFESQIMSVYAPLETVKSSELSLPQSALDVEDLQNSLREVVERILQVPCDWEDQDDLFELGLDSLKATRLQRIINASLFGIVLERRKLERLVYRHPSVQSMAHYLRALIDGVPDSLADSHANHLEDLVQRFSKLPDHSASEAKRSVILLTGSTGSIGCHLVASLAKLAEVEEVICLNRPTKGELDEAGSMDVSARQRRAFDTHFVDMPEAAWSKVTFLTTETQKANAGLGHDTYRQLSRRVTHVIHNAWPMDFKRSVSSFEAHFKSLTNLLQLALDASTRLERRIRFVFHSSIAVTANYANINGSISPVPEAPISDPRIASTMGYAQAKWICERVIEQVAQKYPDNLIASIIRIGQVVGSTSHGAWNVKEHVPALLKTAFSLGKLPEIKGTLSWLPVDIAAAAITDVVLYATSDQLFYHIENPHRQCWKDVLWALQRALFGDEPDNQTVPFDDWLKLAGDAHRQGAAAVTDYPAVELLDFLQTDFQELGAGKVVLEMQNSCRVSRVLNQSSPISPDMIRSFVAYWRSVGYIDTTIL